MLRPAKQQGGYVNLHSIGTHVPGAVATEQAEAMVRTFALERATTAEAGTEAGLRFRPVHVLAVPVRVALYPRHRLSRHQRPHHAQGNELPTGEAFERDKLGRVGGADHIHPDLPLRTGLA